MIIACILMEVGGDRDDTGIDLLSPPMVDTQVGD